MQDPKNIDPQGIDQWARNASPDQVIQVASKLLDKVAGYTDTHRQTFVKSLDRDTRQKLFEDMPVS